LKNILIINIMKIYLIGDIGDYNQQTTKIINNIKKEIKEDDNIVFLGDNFYPFGVKSITDPKWNDFKNFDIQNQVWTILGNHDYLGNIDAQLEFNLKNWNMPNYFYKKTFSNYDFFFIDTSILLPNYSNINYQIVKSKLNRDPMQVSKDMIEWLEEELTNSNNKKFILGHYPLFSFGIYGINKGLFDILFPIFKKYNVKYYISGHDHNLQIIDVSAENYVMKQIISGGGSQTYPLLKDAPDKAFSKLGCVVVNIKDEVIEIKDENMEILYKEPILT
tara:strand:- start:1203 stop:2030 length:828 start_codon:yes stop_codon:yes gene_type:complete